MKKTICMVIVFLIAFGSLINIVSAFEIDITTSRLTAEEFANEVGGLIMSINESDGLPGKSPNNKGNFETARLIVKCRGKLDTLNASSVISGYDSLWIVQFENSDDAAKAYDYYSTRAGVEFVEEDKLLGTSDPVIVEQNTDIYNETKEHLSWGPAHAGFDKFNQAITVSAPAINDTVVAVVDTGVDSDHPFLEGRVIPTRINTSSSGIRNDSEDDQGHGTRIAGIIVDSTLDNVYIKPYKVMDKWGKGSVITVAAGINCAVRDGVDVINISIGFEEDSNVLKAAIRNAEQNDIVVTGAAGNDASDTIYYPASYSSVLKVTAINKENVLGNFSSYGNGVDIAAPGVDIVTTKMGGGYVTVKGTSFAAPFVAAAAASLISVEPHASAEDIKDIILSCAVEVSEHHTAEKFGKGVLLMPDYDPEVIHNGKAETPYFSHSPAYYTENINLEIFCDEPDSVIYYTTDKSVPSKDNPTAKIYDGNPVVLSRTTVLLAVAYSEGKFRSTIANFSAFIIPHASEGDLEVDEYGTLISYSGSDLGITVPNKVNGIEIKKIGDNAFANSEIVEVVCPRSVTEIGASAFENCRNLRTVSAISATKIGENALYNCINLRNIYFGKLSDIGEYSFYNAGCNQFTIEERSFSLNLENIVNIPEGAFMGSSVSSIELKDIDKIEKNAFSECNALVNVKANRVDSIADSVFNGCVSLATVELRNMSYIPTGTFNACTNLLSVSIPEATTVNSGAFENCISLREITLEKVKTIFSNSFSGCSSLRTISLPEMTKFENISDQDITVIPDFPASLDTFNAPKLNKTVSNMFFHSKNIRIINIDSVAEIAPSTFNGCYNIFFLDISGIRTLSKYAFNNCKIEFIDARNLQTTEDMPDNSGILLSNSFIESSDKASNLIIYGTPNTFVERYANHKGYRFVAIPLIYNQIPDYVTENSETIYINAAGFDLTYQWYSNTVNSTEGGKPIKDATTSSYTFTENDVAPYYYCVITQTDMGTVSKITTHVISKDTKPANYSAYDEAVKRAESIDRDIYENIFILDSALEFDVSNRFSCEQDIVDKQTEAILDAISKLKKKTVKSVSLFASDVELGIFETQTISFNAEPADIPYEKIEWFSDNMNVILVYENGTVRCIGDGTANVHARLVNEDGSVTEGTISFNCKLSFEEKFIGILLRPLFILSYWNNLAR